MFIVCLLKYKLTILVLVSTQSTRPLLCHNALSLVLAPLFKNSKCAPGE